MYDIIIKNGMVFDGCGNPWFHADIGIKESRIAAVGKIGKESAKETVDAEGLAVAPGFIDFLSDNESTLFAEDPDLSKPEQGVTTEVMGNIGLSCAPNGGEYVKDVEKYQSFFFPNLKRPWEWNNMDGFLSYLERREIPNNVAMLVGHGVVRIAAMGEKEGAPSALELEGMKLLVKEAMEQGAFGMSSALAFLPGINSGTNELIELTKTVAEQNGICSFYMRSEGDNILASVKELIDIGRRSGVPINFSHLRVAGRNNWGKSADVVKLIDEARGAGIDITGDLYPYLASSYPLLFLLPPWAQDGWDYLNNENLVNPEKRVLIRKQINEDSLQWENFARRAGWENVIISGSRNKAYEGKSIKEIAENLACDPADLVIDMVKSGEAEASVVIFEMSDDDLTLLMRQPYVMVASASLPNFPTPHPRCYGAFPRLLGKYVREKGVISLSDAIRKITSLPAQRLGLRDRGMIKEGLRGDITVFDPNTVDDHANFMIPRIKPTGIKYVLINGHLVIKDGFWTGRLSGRVLRKNREA